MLIFSVVFLIISPFLVICYLQFAIVRFLKSHNKQLHVANQNQCQNVSQKPSKTRPEAGLPKNQRDRNTNSLKGNRQNESDDLIFAVDKENVETQNNRDIPRASKCEKEITEIHRDTGGFSTAGFAGLADADIEIIQEDNVNSSGFATIESLKLDLAKYDKNKSPQNEALKTMACHSTESSIKVETFEEVTFENLLRRTSHQQKQSDAKRDCSSKDTPFQNKVSTLLNSAKPSLTVKAQHRIAVDALLLSGTFFIGFLPYVVARICRLVIPSELTELGYEVTIIFFYIATTCNSVIFFLRKHFFRKQIRRLVRIIC